LGQAGVLPQGQRPVGEAIVPRFVESSGGHAAPRVRPCRASPSPGVRRAATAWPLLGTADHRCSSMAHVRQGLCHATIAYHAPITTLLLCAGARFSPHPSLLAAGHSPMPPQGPTCAGDNERGGDATHLGCNASWALRTLGGRAPRSTGGGSFRSNAKQHEALYAKRRVLTRREPWFRVGRNELHRERRARGPLGDRRPGGAPARCGREAPQKTGRGTPMA
jgi:hypothetical protein